MDRLSDKRRKRVQRKRRVRGKLAGTAMCPRLTVFKSHKNISVQAIDDENGRTIAAASTMEKALDGVKRSVEGGKTVGKTIAERLQAAKVKAVIFDRNGYRYHGIVKAVADGARESGLEF
ncbi:MAG: 50S ribosomal protein L18 [Spirochaetales bacterium]|nr:MAG: 50S ribosomal protein L18 [Spirochaetales bacterium]